MSCTTKTVLADAMRELMRRRPVSKITIGDVCEHCGMNRKSFYYHFHDKYELINWIFTREYDEAAGNAPHQDRLLTLCEYLHREHAFYRSALQPPDSNRLVACIDDALRDMLYARLNLTLPSRDCADLTCCVIACRSVIVHWLQSGCDMPADAFVRMLYRAGGLLGKLGA